MATEPTGGAQYPTDPPAARRAGRGARAHEHPDVELLDTFADGEPLARPVEEHIRGCGHCLEAIAALRQVRTDLSRLAALTMPGDVAARIQAALAARAPAPPRQDADQADRKVAGKPRHPGTGSPHAGGLDPTASNGGPPAGSARSPGAGRDPDLAGAAGHGGSGHDESAGHDGSAGADRSRAPVGDGAATSGRRYRGVRRGRRSPRPVERHRSHQDWVSIAAACVAFVTFGAAIFAYRSMQTSDSDHGFAASSPLGSARADETAPQAQAEAAAPPSAPSIVLADSRAPVDAASIVRHGRELLHGQIVGSAALPLVLSSAMSNGPSDAAESTDSAAGRSDPSTHEDSSAASAPTPGAPPSAPVGPLSQASEATASRLRSLLVTSGLSMCYQSLTAQTGGSLLAVDRIVYDDQPALLIVLSIPEQPTSVRMLAVDVRCGVTSISSALWYSVTTERE